MMIYGLFEYQTVEKIRKIGENELKNWKYIPFWNKLIKKREKLCFFLFKITDKRLQKHYKNP